MLRRLLINLIDLIDLKNSNSPKLFRVFLQRCHLNIRIINFKNFEYIEVPEFSSHPGRSIGVKIASNGANLTSF